MGRIRCPLCISSSTTLVKEIRGAELRDSWQKTFRIDISQQIEGSVRVEFFDCRSCGLQFYTPPTLAGSTDLYSQLQKYPWYYTPGKWEYDIALQHLLGCEAILEVGCGAGEFITRARSEKKLDVQGIDTNQEAVDKARRIGLSVEVMELRQAAAQWPGRYNAVCAFQVLEHVANPKDFLEWSCALLKSKGWLILGLPNAESFLKYQFNLLDMPPHHMTKWSERVLKYLPDLFPLRLIEIRLEPLAEYHVADYVKAYCSLYASRGVPKFFYPRWLQRGVRDVLTITRLRKLLIGQTLYARLQRI